jgi:3-hydroxyisobutyrate dehydrogenase-like beta-hydroxyacid dehydrogenase
MDFAAETIGFLGLGAIGEPIATRLSGGNHKLVVFDVRREAVEPFAEVAEVAASPKAVGDRADIVFSCLASADAHRDALLGPRGLIHGKRVRTYVNLGTTGASLVRELGDAMEAHRIATVDAPVTGGVGRARNGTLTTMAAGDRSAFDAAVPLMQLYASKIVWLGTRLGSAQVMKLVNNAVSFANLAAACEALLVGAKSGLDPVAMLEVLNSGSGQNSATLMKIPSDVLTGKFKFGGSLAIVIKDYKAFLEEAEALGIEPSIGQAVLETYIAALALASESGDVTEVIRPMEIAAGIELRKARGQDLTEGTSC